MAKITSPGLILCLMSLAACQSNQPDPQPDPGFRSQFAGTYKLYRINQQGTVGQDTTTTFEGIVELEVSYDPGDSMRIFPGYEQLPAVAFGDHLKVALRENGRFVEIDHRTVPGSQVEGGFMEPDSVYLHTEYVHGGTEFLLEVLKGRKVK